MNLSVSNRTERLTAGFAVGFSLLVWSLSGRTQAGLGLIALNAGIAALVLLALPKLRHQRSPWLAFLGISLPYLFFYVFYRETALVLSRPDIHWFDSVISRFEEVLWPAAGHGHPLWLGDWAAFFYMSYVPLLLGVTLILMSNGRAKAESNVRRICLAWSICYIIFLVYPVLGPRFFFPDLQAARIGGGPFTRLTLFNQQSAQLRGAAFPSAHVAAATASLMSLWAWKRPWFWIILPLGAGLAVGAVYLAYHYAADVAAGLAVGLLAVGLDNWWQNS